MNFLQNFFAMASGFSAPLTRLVRRRWLRTLIWALAACLVVFFYGDALRLRRWQPFDSDTARLWACAAIVAGWAIYNVVMAVRDRQANASMISAMTADGQGPSRSDLSAQELEQMRTRLQEAMTQMRRVAGGRRDYVYQLPWYIMIGPPGSGKTTALLNSGLKFPLADSLAANRCMASAARATAIGGSPRMRSCSTPQGAIRRRTATPNWTARAGPVF